jgi:hypothetical protein
VVADRGALPIWVELRRTQRREEAQGRKGEFDWEFLLCAMALLCAFAFFFT